MPQNGFGQGAYSASYPSVMGRPASVIAAHPERTRYKPGGVTIDWNTVASVLADTTDALTGNVVVSGQKYLRYGVVLCRLATGKYGPYSAKMADTTLNGAVVVGQTVVPITLATNVNPGDTLHIAAGGGTAEDLVVQSVSGNTVTFQTGAAFAHNTGTAVTEVDDGRQTLRRGECFILDRTVILGQDLGANFAAPVFDGGCTVYLERVASDFGSSGLASNPTRAVLEAGFPTLDWLIN